MTTFALTDRRRYRRLFFGRLVLQVEEVVKRTLDPSGVTTSVIWRNARANDLSDVERQTLT